MEKHTPMKLSSSLGLSLAVYAILSITLSVATSSNLSGQEPDYRTIFSDAEYYFFYNEFREALPLYKQLLENEPNNANIQYRIGLCYLNIPGIKGKALPYLQEAAKRISTSYNEGSFREEAAPPLVHFYLGEVYRVTGQLDKAIDAYTQFRNQLEARDTYNQDFVNQQINACNRAVTMMQDPINVEREHLELFPSRDVYIFNPIKSYDGNSLVVTVKEVFYDAIYWSRRVDDSWTEPINITLDLAVEGETYATSLNYDGTELYLFVNDGGVGNIYRSILVDGKWGKISKLGRNINTRSWETHASISPDGNMLLFSSNRRGGYGGLDLYYSIRQKNGDWGSAENLGSTINTPHNEETPFLSTDGSTLYFSSQGHNSIGGYDIFYSQRTNEEQWASPTNMGYPVNTPDDDLFYFPLDEDCGLVALIDEDKPGVRRVYTLTIVEGTPTPDIALMGNISLTDGASLTPSLFSVSVCKQGSTEPFAAATIDSSGSFSLSVAPGDYVLQAQGDGYAQVSLPVIIPEAYSQPTYPVDLSLTPDRVAEGDAVAIRSILFDFDSDSLTNNAIYEVEKILSTMSRYPSLAIEVAGHTDNIGSVAYNEELAMRRAMAVISYLDSNGIDSARLVARSASSLENIAANYNPDGSDNPEGRSLNRRVSVSVISSEDDVQIVEDLNVPEHLRPREQDYTILVAPLNRTLTKQQKDSVELIASIFPEKVEGQYGQFVYTVGNYSHKSESIHTLNDIIEAGFDLASLMGKEDLRNFISRPQVQTQTSGRNLYTIQLLAQSKPIKDSSLFKNLDVQEIKGEDGLYRYVYGEYGSRKEADSEIERVKSLGFTDAFIKLPEQKTASKHD